MKKYEKKTYFNLEMKYAIRFTHCHAECVCFHYIVRTMKNSKVGRCVSAKCNWGGGGKKTKNGVKMTKKTGCEQIFYPNFSLNLKKDSIKRVLSCFRILKFHRRSTQEYSQAICIFSRAKH